MIATLLAILVGILWVFLPFAVFGTKAILRANNANLAILINQNNQILALLERPSLPAVTDQNQEGAA